LACKHDVDSSDSDNEGLMRRPIVASQAGARDLLLFTEHNSDEERDSASTSHRCVQSVNLLSLLSDPVQLPQEFEAPVTDALAIADQPSNAAAAPPARIAAITETTVLPPVVRETAVPAMEAVMKLETDIDSSELWAVKVWCLVFVALLWLALFWSFSALASSLVHQEHASLLNINATDQWDTDLPLRVIADDCVAAASRSGFAQSVLLKHDQFFPIIA